MRRSAFPVILLAAIVALLTAPAAAWTPAQVALSQPVESRGGRVVALSRRPAPGALLVAFPSCSVGAASTLTLTSPPGWTLIGVQQSTQVRTWAYYRVSDGTERRSLYWRPSITTGLLCTIAVHEYGGFSTPRLVAWTSVDSRPADLRTFAAGSLPAAPGRLWIAAVATRADADGFVEGWSQGFRGRTPDVYTFRRNPTILVADTGAEHTGTVAPTVGAVTGWTATGFLLAFDDGGPLTPVPSAPIDIVAATDGTDQTATINAQIVAAPAGTLAAPTLLRLPSGRIHVEGTVLLQAKEHVILEGGDAGTTLYAEAPGTAAGVTSTRAHVRVFESHGVTVRTLRVESSNTVSDPSTLPALTGKYSAAWEAEHGFSVESSSETTIENVSAYGVWGDCVFVGGLTPALDTTIRDVLCEWNGRQGIGVAHAEGLLIDGVLLPNGRRSGIDLEPYTDAQYVSGVEIVRADLSQRGHHIAAKGASDVSNVYVHDCIFRSQGAAIVEVSSSTGKRRREWRFENNAFVGGQLSSAPEARSLFVRVDGVSFRGNVLPQSAGAYGLRQDAVFLRETTGVEIRDNAFGELCLIRTSDAEMPIHSGNVWGAQCGPEHVVPY